MIKSINKNTNEKNLLIEIDRIFSIVKSYYSHPNFSKNEKEILYTVLEEYSFSDAFKPATVFGMPSLMVLKKDITESRRSLTNIINDLNKLIDFLNLILNV